MSRGSASRAVSLHADNGVQNIETRFDCEVKIQKHIRKLFKIASDCEMPAHPFTAFDESEQVFDAECEDHHRVGFGFGNVGDGIVFLKFRCQFKVVKPDFRREGKTFVVREVRHIDVEPFQLLFDSHGTDDRGGSLNRRVFQQGNPTRSRIKEQAGCFNDERRVNAGDIIFMPPGKQIRLQHDLPAGDSAGIPDLFLQNPLQRGAQVRRGVIRACRIKDRSGHGGGLSFL